MDARKALDGRRAQARWSIDYETDARLPYGVARDGVPIAGFARREWAEAFIELARAEEATRVFTRLVLAYDSTP